MKNVGNVLKYLAVVVCTVLITGFDNTTNIPSYVDGDIIPTINVHHGWWETIESCDGLAWMVGRIPAYTNTTPSIEIIAWRYYGRFNLYWKSSLTSSWESVCTTKHLYSGVNRYIVYMHPDSELTKAMMHSPTGFFSQQITCAPRSN